MTDKADRIQRLLNDTDLKDAFKDVESAIFQRIKQCPQRDIEGLSYLHLSLHTLESVKASLYQHVREGKVKDFQAVEQQQRTFLGDEDARPNRRIDSRH